jgi:hypothetical protein
VIGVQFVEFMAAVGVVAGATVGVLALMERVTGWFGTWVRRQVTEAIRPTEGIVRHHLGPNGDTVPIHHRLGMLEQKLSQCPHTHDGEAA